MNNKIKTILLIVLILLAYSINAQNKYISFSNSKISISYPNNWEDITSYYQETGQQSNNLQLCIREKIYGDKCASLLCIYYNNKTDKTTEALAFMNIMPIGEIDKNAIYKKPRQINIGGLKGHVIESYFMSDADKLLELDFVVKKQDGTYFEIKAICDRDRLPEERFKIEDIIETLILK